jgi:calcineurin-like phosphoesterase family protein
LGKETHPVMANIFLISDTHFGHVGVTQFMSKDGVNKLRPWDNTQDMDEALVANWNSVVRPCDKVYHLGDVVINRKALHTLSRLNGDKVLIKGNHDIFRLEEYTLYFRDIRGYHIMDNMIMSHIPVHTDSKGRFRANIHGHLHDRTVKRQTNGLASILDDHWYFNVSVERINFTPIAFEEVRKHFQT